MATGWFALLGLLVLGPLLRPGYLLLLDAPTGPDLSWPSPFPLSSEGLITPHVPAAALARITGLISTQLPNKLLIFLCVFVGGMGIYRFATVTLKLSVVPAVASATFFVINPFVYDRLLAGQLLLTAAYALMPWALPTLAAVARGQDRGEAFRGIAWVAGITIVDIHVGGMMLLALVIALLLSPRPLLARIGLSVLAPVLLIGVNMFWILPAALAGTAELLGPSDLLAYAPRPHSVAILPRALLLHGFWRTEFATPLSEHTELFLATFLPVMGISVGGLLVAVRNPYWRRLAVGLAVVCLIALILGMGTSFPVTAGLTRLLYEHVPGYSIYREPQKWIGLLALGYAIFFGVGVAAVQTFWRGRAGRLRVLVAGAVLLPLLATPLVMWGFTGTAAVSQFPDAWERARQITADGDGKLLFFPWNLYQPLPFADNRIIANPAEHYFDISVLVSGDTGFAKEATTEPFDPRDRYISELLGYRHRLRALGHLVAPLGVRYVALAKVADASLYGFLRRQRDLQEVFDSPDLVLYRNTAFRGEDYGLIHDHRQSSVRDLIRDAALQPLAVTGLMAVRKPDQINTLPGAEVVEPLPFWKEIVSTDATSVGTDLSCDDGWRLGDEDSICNLGAVAAFESEEVQASLWRPALWTQIAGYVVATSVWAILLLRLVRSRSGLQRDRPHRVARLWRRIRRTKLE